MTISKFRRHLALHPERGDDAEVCLRRESLIEDILGDLTDGYSLRVSGSDNTGKTTLLNLVAQRKEVQKHLFFWMFPVCYHGFIEDCESMLTKSLRRLTSRLRTLGVEVPLASLENLDSLSASIKGVLGRTPVYIVDDLYRFDGQWDNFPTAKMVLERIGTPDNLSWIITDNEATTTVSNNCPGDKYRTHKVPFFSYDECGELIEKHFPSLISDNRDIFISPIYSLTQGCPYQVMAIAAMVDELEINSPEDLQFALTRIGNRPDKTILKVLDYAIWNPTIDQMIGKIFQHPSDPKIGLKRQGEIEAGLKLASTGAFKICNKGDSKFLKPANTIFASALRASLPTKTSRTTPEHIVDTPPATLPVFIRKLVSDGHNQRLILEATAQNIVKHQAEKLPTIVLETVLAVTEFPRAAMYMPDQHPTKRIILVGAVGNGSEQYTNHPDELSWATGMATNSWLGEAMESDLPIVFSRPFNGCGRLPLGKPTELKLDERWRGVFQDSGVVIGIPFSSESNLHTALLVLDTVKFF